MKYKALALSLVSVLGLSACQQESTDKTSQENAAVITKADLKTQEETQSYALGENIGQYISGQFEQQEKLGLVLDKELVVKGFSAAINGNAIMTQEETAKVIQEIQATMQAKQQEQAAMQGEKNLEEGQAYLVENAKRDGVMSTESGIQYEVIEQGEGNKPSAEDTVKVHYHGTLIDGTVFDSSYDRGEPAVFPLNRVIKGWTEGVQLMNVGSKYRFHIPAHLAYGERATGKIGPNSTLVFDVELLGIESEQAE
ncbi:MAG: FKBP-type peptidyl-prolyl cis-trans isomerase [Aestuariibacter sp.]